LGRLFYRLLYKSCSYCGWFLERGVLKVGLSLQVTLISSFRDCLAPIASSYAWGRAHSIAQNTKRYCSHPSGALIPSWSATNIQQIISPRLRGYAFQPCWGERPEQVKEIVLGHFRQHPSVGNNLAIKQLIVNKPNKPIQRFYSPIQFFLFEL
jgi:hypothetical protein